MLRKCANNWTNNLLNYIVSAFSLLEVTPVINHRDSDETSNTFLKGCNRFNTVEIKVAKFTYWQDTKFT